MEGTTDSPKEIRRSMVLRHGESGRQLNTSSTAVPEPNDVYEDEESVFSFDWDRAAATHEEPLAAYALSLTRLVSSYIPAPWFSCTPHSYYAPEIKSKMGNNCIALVAVNSGLFEFDNPNYPTKIMIVPPEAGMYVRPVTRGTSLYQAESALPWVTFKASPIIQAKIEAVIPDDITQETMIQVAVSVLVEDVVAAASYYSAVMEAVDLLTFKRSLQSLDAHSITTTLVLPSSLPKGVETSDDIRKGTVPLRLCFFFHKVLLANYEPL